MMEKVNIQYSLKNIGIPSKFQYEKTLLDKTIDFIDRMRKKLHFIKNPNNGPIKNTYGFKSNWRPGPDYDIKPFEDDLLDLVANIEFNHKTSDFQQTLRNDMTVIKNEGKVILKGDKSNNLYKENPETYKQKLNDQVTNIYRKCPNDTVNRINHEAADIVKKLDIADRVDIMSKNVAFLTAKDHKPNFSTRPTFRLINPAKTYVGSISKQILDRVNSDLRLKTKLNQWQSTKAVINWFKSLENKERMKFIKLDIENYFPSINAKVLNDAVNWANAITEISAEEQEIIIHCRKTFLFDNYSTWVKKDNPDMDVSQGSLDSAELCELVGLFLLHQVKSLIPVNLYGIYRDDFLAAVRLSMRQIEQLNKKLHKLFNENGFRITIEPISSFADFLDVSFNLENGSYKPYRKDNDIPLYINVKSNHPPHVKKELPKMISKRISGLSSSEEVFEREKHIYDEALKNSGYTSKTQYIEENETPKKKKRQRNILWYVPPWNDQVSTPIGQLFLKLLDKHFPPGHPLHYHFNRQKVKVSYSCMSNVYGQISANNKKILYPETQNQEKGCNCTGGVESCPLDGGHCQTNNVIYHADLKFQEINNNTNRLENKHKTYTGSCSTTFKIRWNNHNQSIRWEHKELDTTLSKEIWRLKRLDPNINFDLKWKIEKLANIYNAEQRKCQLCLTEKTVIMFQGLRNRTMNGHQGQALNRRTEIHRKCPHFEKFRLSNW